MNKINKKINFVLSLSEYKPPIYPKLTMQLDSKDFCPEIWLSHSEDFIILAVLLVLKLLLLVCMGVLFVFSERASPFQIFL